MIELGARVAARRKELGLSQADLAAAANVHQTMISSIELDRKMPTLELLVRLQDVLGIALIPAPASVQPENFRSAAVQS